MTNARKILVGVAALAALALGGAALAGATSGGKDEHPLAGDTFTRAKAAALAATGGGRVNETERDGEQGATYEVEVTKPGGSQVDVRLDERFGVVAIDSDEEDAGDRDD
jgi:uncharacterized membrane protein YkoI